MSICLHRQSAELAVLQVKMLYVGAKILTTSRKEHRISTAFATQPVLIGKQGITQADF